MKKILSAILVLTILMSFASCGAGDKAPSSTELLGSNTQTSNPDNQVNEEKNSATQSSSETVSDESKNNGSSAETGKPVESSKSEHKHTFSAATCTEAKKCKTCGATAGKALGHSFSVATCKQPKICKNCKITQGKKLAHDFYAGECKNCKAEDPDMQRVYSEGKWYSFVLPNFLEDCGARTVEYHGDTETEFAGEHTVIWSSVFEYGYIGLPVFTFIVLPYSEDKFDGYYGEGFKTELIYSDDKYDVYCESLLLSEIPNLTYVGEVSDKEAKINQLKTVIAMTDEIIASFRWEK